MRNEQDETVHERVRRLRERKGWSQAELAAATDNVVTEAWLQKFEKKHQPKWPTRDQLEPLAGPLATSLSYLLAPMRIAPIEEVAGDPLLTDLPHSDRDILERLAIRFRESPQAIEAETIPIETTPESPPKPARPARPA